MLYFLVFMLVSLFVILIILFIIDGWTNNYPKHIEDRSFLAHVYARNQRWPESVDCSRADARGWRSPDSSIERSKGKSWER